MRCSISSRRFIRFGILIVAAAALQTLVIAAPALARSHGHVHRFIARRQVLTIRDSEFSPGFPSFFRAVCGQRKMGSAPSSMIIGGKTIGT